MEWQAQPGGGGDVVVAVLPRAVVPLWQLEQLPVTLAWLKWPAVQAVVEWQSPQSLVVAMWLAGLPVAVVPLWQLEQVPVTWRVIDRRPGPRHSVSGSTRTRWWW